MQGNTIAEIAQLLFESPTQARIGATVIDAVLQAQSGRWTEIARAMAGTEDAAYK